MYHGLHLRINLDHPRPKIRVIPHQHLGIPRARHEDRIHPAANRRQEDLTHLQPDQEGKRHDDGCELAAFIVCRVRELEVEEREQAAEVGDEGAAHGEDRPDEAIVDEGVDAAVFHHTKITTSAHIDFPRVSRPRESFHLRPRILSSRDIRLPIQRNMTEGISIDELYRPIQQPNYTPQAAKRQCRHGIPILSLLLLRDTHSLSNHINYGHN